jgi:hypothetical protein
LKGPTEFGTIIDVYEGSEGAFSVAGWHRPEMGLMAEKPKTRNSLSRLCWIVLLLVAFTASERGAAILAASSRALAPATRAGGENDWFVYLGNQTPPKAPPKQISAAEALPPLPLPATPLRRTERKKPQRKT